MCVRTTGSATKLVFASNGHTIALAARDEGFRATLQQADIPLQKLFCAAGKLSAMAGRRHNDYAAIHGE